MTDRDSDEHDEQRDAPEQPVGDAELGKLIPLAGQTDGGEPTDDELADELRRLFRDDRMSLSVQSGATDAVVSLVGRRRHRKAVLSSVAAVFVVLATVSGGIAAVALSRSNTVAVGQPGLSTMSSGPATSGGQRQTEPPTGTAPKSNPGQNGAPPTHYRPTVPATRPQAPQGVLIGPDGYAKLTIGMSEADADADGLLSGSPPVAPTTPPTDTTGPTTDGNPPPRQGCDTRHPAGHPSVRVTFSSNSGLVEVAATDAHTPEGVGTGSTVDDVLAAYSNADSLQGQVIVPVGKHANYVFMLDGDTVTQLSLQVPQAAC